eukprot:5916927-Prymnesium_polylepis.1
MWWAYASAAASALGRAEDAEVDVFDAFGGLRLELAGVAIHALEVHRVDSSHQHQPLRVRLRLGLRSRQLRLGRLPLGLLRAANAPLFRRLRRIGLGLLPVVVAVLRGRQPLALAKGREVDP